MGTVCVARNGIEFAFTDELVDRLVYCMYCIVLHVCMWLNGFMGVWMRVYACICVYMRVYVCICVYCIGIGCIYVDFEILRF